MAFAIEESMVDSRFQARGREMRSQEVINSSFAELERIIERFSAQMKQGITEVFDSYRRSSLQNHASTNPSSPMAHPLRVVQFHQRTDLHSCDEDQLREDTKLVEAEVETTIDPFIKPLKLVSVLQVPDSIPEELLVNKTALYVKEVKSLPQRSTSVNGKLRGHQMFDTIPLMVTSKEKYQEVSPMIKSAKDVELSFSHTATRVWKPGGLPYKLDHCEWAAKVLKSHRESRQVETLAYPQMHVMNGDVEDLKTYDRKMGHTTGHTTLCSDYEQNDGYKRKEVMKLISSWNNRVWEPGGVPSELAKWEGLVKSCKHGGVMRLLLDGSDFSTKVSDTSDHNKKLSVMVTSLSKSFRGSITIFKAERGLRVVSFPCFMGISLWTTVLWNRKTRKKKITSWWHWEEWLETYKEFKPLFEQSPKELSPAGIKWHTSSYLGHKVESETGSEANDHVCMRLLLWGTFLDVIAGLLQCVEEKMADLKSNELDKPWEVKMTDGRLIEVEERSWALDIRQEAEAKQRSSSLLRANQIWDPGGLLSTAEATAELLIPHFSSRLLELMRLVNLEVKVFRRGKMCYRNYGSEWASVVGCDRRLGPRQHDSSPLSFSSNKT